MQALCGLQGIFDLFNCKTPVHTCFRIGDWHLDAILSDFDVLIEKNLIFCGKLPVSVPYVCPYSLTSFA